MNAGEDTCYAVPAFAFTAFGTDPGLHGNVIATCQGPKSGSKFRRKHDVSDSLPSHRGNPMRARRAIIVFGASMWTFSAPVIALAQGTITGVSPETSPGIACKLDTIRISGTGSCSTFTFQLGDSTPIVHLPGNFPILVYHTYTHAGTYALKAQGQGNCTGAVTASLHVLGPAITSIFPFSVIKPGGGVIIAGQNFGDLPGQILMKFQNQLVGVPLQNIQWGDTFASGTIPQGISGQPDQQVVFTVVAQCGAVSNEWSAMFTAARDIAALPFGRIDCSTSVGAGNSDQCQDWGQNNQPTECFQFHTFGLQPGATGFYGYHASGWGFSGESGNDQFWATLNNSWVLDSITGLSGTRVGNGSDANEWNPSQPGTPNPKLTVLWHADNCGIILYWGDMMITGPRGLPY
jgi:hypothetical protein